MDQESQEMDQEMDQESEILQVRANVPTLPAVTRILQNHGELKEGDLITYSDLEQWIFEKRESNRYKSVVVAWRKALRHDYNLLLTCVTKVGFKVLDAPERIGVSSKRFRRGVERIIVSSIDARDTDPTKLDEPARRQRDHLVNLGSSYILAEATRPKQLL